MDPNMEIAQDQCRLCNAEEAGVVNIFEDEWNNQENTIASQIQEMFQLALADTEDWPRRCCAACARFMEEMKTFKGRIIERHCALVQIYKKITESKANHEATNNSLPDHLNETVIEYVFIVEDPVCDKKEPIPSEVIEIEDEDVKDIVAEEGDQGGVRGEDKPSDGVNAAQESVCRPSTSNAVQAVQSEKKKPELVCGTCGHSFVRKDFYRRHIGFCGGEKGRFLCSYCDKAFSKLQAVQRHVRRLHEKVYSHTCGVCGRSFADPYYLKMHLKCHEGPQKKKTRRRVKCKEDKLEQCNLCRNYYANLYQHKQKIHRVGAPFLWGKGKVICDRCGRYISCKGNLSIHYSRCGKPKPKGGPFKCNLCDRMFSSAGHLKMHINGVHQKTREIACPHCDFKSVSRGNRLRHFRYSHPEEYEKCKVKATAPSEETRKS